MHEVPDIFDGMPLSNKLHVALAELKRFYQKISECDPVKSASKELLLRTLLVQNFGDDYEPERPNLPNVRQTLKLFSDILESTIHVSNEFLYDRRHILTQFFDYSRGRDFMITDQGYFGLALCTSLSNDIVVVIFGCHSPIVLRSIENEQYLVVGESYIHQVLKGDTLLGPLSND